MPSTTEIPRRISPLRRIAIAAIVAVVGIGVTTTEAHALLVSSDASGLQMREPNNTLNRVKLSLVDSGGLKYRVEMAQFGGQGIQFGPGCVQASTQEGVDVALCDRINPVVSHVSLGPMRDTFDADPTFPDPIIVNDGGLGPDIFRLGAGNDIARGTDDSFVGGAGDDDLFVREGSLDGGDGNDSLRASKGSVRMDGGVGDDTLSADAAAEVTMVGGEGKDAFDAGGANSVIDSRDGISEQVSCGKPTRVTGRVRSFRIAVVDLVDAPDDQGLVAGGCSAVDRAPVGEETAAQVVSKSLKLRDGEVKLKLRCTSSERCTGRVSITVRGRSSAKRFSIKGHRSAQIPLRSRPGRAVVQTKEKGQAGDRGTVTTLKVKR
jgi:hypothetical protein